MALIGRAVPVSLCLVAIAVGAPMGLAAQPSVGRVGLSVRVPAQATIAHHTVVGLRSPVGDSTTFTATVIVRANAPYRLVARRVAGPPIAVAVWAESSVRLDVDRSAVQVARGDAGLTTFELSYSALIDDDWASVPRVMFEAVPDPIRTSSR
jgi:hypothetical protein